MFTIFRRTALAGGIVLLAISACKKDHNTATAPNAPAGPRPGVTAGSAFSSGDSMYFLFRDEYLSNDVILRKKCWR
ncbi:hypothetical protein F0L74_16575 [Chitinophaga agrisoli]|uniref:Uncharacterized protein n=1 Tax=Chitinophaga agrisoli TaxID=2607653 RepID=A0A5B2VSA0_9BACT|nr:hypothetical protein [Chitinophaga agrisoli]KAA2241510.1 hypothetical protein F0L74_16575 [Chitinophaga agrisoli]